MLLMLTLVLSQFQSLVVFLVPWMLTLVLALVLMLALVKQLGH
jgi:hypothetical protein